MDVMDVQERAKDLIERTQGRRDMAALSDFLRDPGSVPATGELFWAVYKLNIPSGDLAIPDEEELVSILTELEQITRIDYQPDEHIHEEDAFISAHLYTIVALLKKKRQGYSEEVRDAISGALRALQPGFGPGLNVYKFAHGTDPFQYNMSVMALVTILGFERYQIALLDREYEEALDYLAKSILQLDYLVPYAVQFHLGRGWDTTVTWPLLHNFTAINWGHKAEFKSVSLKDIYFVPHLGSDEEKAADEWNTLFDGLKDTDVKDWPRVKENAEILSSCLIDFDFYEDYQTWRSFWEGVGVWAEARLQPSERHEAANKALDEQAKNRLVSYFFGECLWLAMPERAQQSLVNADRTWFETTTYGRIADVVVDIWTATGSLMELFWSRLDKSDYGSNRDFQELRTNLEWKNPSVDHFRQMLGTTAFRDWTASLDFDDNDNKFLVGRLPEALDKLNRARNKSEHDYTIAQDRQQVRPLFRQFLGIGRSGILPELARICQKHELWPKDDRS